MTEFSRPKAGFRFRHGGMKTNAAPDALPPGKYPYLLNVRGLGDDFMRTRPGQTQLFATGGQPVIALRAYAGLFTDDLPRLLACDTLGKIWLDNSIQVGALAEGTIGASMIPFRPAESSNPYMYIGNASDYQKFSVPDINNNVIQNKVGIAEPQSPPDAIAANQYQSFLWPPAGGGPWTSAGTAGAVTTSGENRVNDTIARAFQDPVGDRMTLQIGSNSSLGGSVTSATVTAGGSYTVPIATVSFSGGGGSGATGQVAFGFTYVDGIKTYYVEGIRITNGGSGYTSAPSVSISSSDGSGASATATISGGTPSTLYAYQRWMVVSINGQLYQVQDVLPALPQALAIEAIYYYSGSTGKCVVVPANLAAGPGAEGESLYLQNILANLRRGAILTIGSEAVYVLDVIVGPDGTICFETTTTGTHTASEVISGLSGIVVVSTGLTAGSAIASLMMSFQVTSGIGTVTALQNTNPFISADQSFQPDDYIHFSVNIDNLANLTEMKILFDVGDGSFTENFYYYTVRPNDIIAALAVTNPLTQLAVAQQIQQRAVIDEEDIAEKGMSWTSASSAQTAPGSSQWSEIVFPISALTRVGNDQTRSLQNLNSVQMLFNASGTINVLANSISVTGGFQPDVGDAGQPYLYRVRPRSALTGVVGNPSPATRYGVNPRRQEVFVYPPSAAYDPQIDTWDIERFGGAVTSWRYIGQIPTSSTLPFFDNFSDDAAQGGDELEFDNFEPWPSIDLPLTPATYGPGSVITANVCGVTAQVTVPGVSTSSRGFPQITSWLPGTLVQLSNGNTYTLWARPTFLSGGSGSPSTYLFQFVENAGAATDVSILVEEPIVANQHLPYLWGPDAGGTVFAVGDPLRPGTLYFAKNFAPDSAPDSYNIELSPPSEPLLGGEIMDGLSFVASSRRWWALYPQPDNPTQRYNPVQMPFTHGLAAPFGHCTDGKSLFWWADDGIYSSSAGSLTDADLYNLFPHDGVVGQNVTYTGDFTAYAPDYSRAGTFRLAWQDSILYAVYQDITGTRRMLVCDLSRDRVAWSIDIHSPTISAIYALEQQAGTLLTSTMRYPELFFGTGSGVVSSQTDLANDTGGLIACAVATAEYDGGDLRAPKFWGDMFVDTLPASNNSGLSVTPMSLGVAVQAATSLVAGTVRQRSPVAVSGVSDFMGLLLTWTDDFSTQITPTILYDWQPSYAIQPVRMIAFSTMGTDFDLNGYMHIRQIGIAWISTAPITLAISTFDGQSPPAITIPSSGGKYQKAMFPVGPNKGQLFFFEASSTAPFQFFFDDFEMYVGAWGRGDAYKVVEGMGGRVVEQSAA